MRNLNGFLMHAKINAAGVCIKKLFKRPIMSPLQKDIGNHVANECSKLRDKTAKTNA